MLLHEVIWKEQFLEKIEGKHAINSSEVEQVLFGESHHRRVEKGRMKGEDLYVAYGETVAGRNLVVFFIHKRRNAAALPISARDMTASERRYYEQHQKKRSSTR